MADRERRRRLVRRHRLGRTAADGMEAVQAVAAFHSTDPVTPYLGMWARVSGFDTAHLDRLLWEHRSLWRLHAMRRTLFLVPTTQAAAFLTGAAGDIARKERARLTGWLADAMPAQSVRGWLERTTAQVMEVLAKGEELSTQELARAVPDLNRRIQVGSGRWTQEVPVSSRLLYVLGMEGRIVRTRPAGSWRSSQYRWAAATRWWENPPAAGEDVAAARVEITRRYLATHGPATLADLRWWTGWTVAAVRTALAEAGTVTVDLASGDEGYVLDGDVEPDPVQPGPQVALLPGLDPTPMGWKARAWYLGPHGEVLFDSNGNAGPTVWVDGRVVGAWAQRPDGRVVYRLLEQVEASALDRLEAEAESLSRWLDGQVVSIRFKTPLYRDLAEAGS